MRVILENFGPIKRVEFDLTKDLNVIFGENNIGKSYAITALYIILKHLLAEFGGDIDQHIQGLRPGPEFYGNYSTLPIERKPSRFPTLAGTSRLIREQLATPTYSEEADVTVPMTHLLHGVVATALEEGLSNSFNNSFQSVAQLTKQGSGEPLVITVVSEGMTLVFRASGNRLLLANLELHTSFVARKKELQNEIDLEEQQTVLYFKTVAATRADEVADSTLIQAVTLFVIHNLGQQVRAVARVIYFLPASRSGLYQALNTLSALLAELSKSRSFAKKGFSLPSFSEPVADYFLQLSTIEATVEPGEVAAIAEHIERDILGGEIGFNAQTKKLFFRQYSGGEALEMDLSATSSMVSEIAPVVAYFKYVLRYELTTDHYDFDELVSDKAPERHLIPSLIFIEEPEAHLHPKVQVKLMEFFARLSKHNVKVVMTSHSNYMFNKLSNLLLTGELEPEKVGSYLMRATPEGSVMDATAMRAEEEGIADENFVDVAEQLYNERLAAYDKFNAQQK